MDDAGRDELVARVQTWRDLHPTRRYVGENLERALLTEGREPHLSQQRAGVVFSRAASAASGAPGDASRRACLSPSAFWRSGEPVLWEVMCVPFSQAILGGQGTKNVGDETELFTFQDPASGGLREHTTSVERMMALAKTHPLVATTTQAGLKGLRQERVVDRSGRATSGHQSPYTLSLSLAVTGKVLKIGLCSRWMLPGLFALWWKPHGPGWKKTETKAARMVFFDVAEVAADHLFPAEGEDADWTLVEVPEHAASGAAGAGRGGRARGGDPPGDTDGELVDAEELARAEAGAAGGADWPASCAGGPGRAPAPNVGLSDSCEEEPERASTDSEASQRERGELLMRAEGRPEELATEGSDSSEYVTSTSSADEEPPEEEQGPPIAASGALRGVVRSRLREELAGERQVHFWDFPWPENSPAWLCSVRYVKKRRKRMSKFLAILEETVFVVPQEGDFLTGMPHVNNNKDKKGLLFPVVRAIASQKMYYLAVLTQALRNVDVQAGRFLCSAYPNLAPASGGHGGERVEYVDRSSPLWDVLRKEWEVRTVPDFLKHLCTKHNGEARLFGEASWIPLTADVCEPAFWSYQFARTNASRRWLAEREAKAPLNGRAEKLSIEEVHWLLDEGGGRTLLIRRVRAASGAARFLIRTGGVVTLPEILFLGMEVCSVYDMYKLYMDLPIFCHKRTHSKKRQRT